MYESSCRMKVNNVDSLNLLRYAIEEEALMYLVNELPKGKDVRIESIQDDDIVLVSKHTPEIEIKHNYIDEQMDLWYRKFSHCGDMYENVDMILRKNTNYFSRQKIGMMIELIPDSQDETFPAGHAWVSFKVIEDYSYDYPHTMHRVVKHKKLSTLDLLI